MRRYLSVCQSILPPHILVNVFYHLFPAPKHDNQSFLRVVNTPNRGIGTQTVNNLMQKAKEYNLSLFDASRMLNNSKLDSFINLINNFKERSKDVSLPKLLETIYR